MNTDHKSPGSEQPAQDDEAANERTIQKTADTWLFWILFIAGFPMLFGSNIGVSFVVISAIAVIATLIARVVTMIFLPEILSVVMTVGTFLFFMFLWFNGVVLNAK